MLMKERFTTLYNHINQSSLPALFGVSRQTINTWLNKPIDRVKPKVYNNVALLDKKLETALKEFKEELNNEHKGKY